MRRKTLWCKVCQIGLVAILALGITCGAADAKTHVKSDRTPTIAVGLESNKTICTITCNTAFVVTDAKGKAILKLRPSDKLSVKSGKNGITVNGKQCSGDRIAICPDAKEKNAMVTLDGTPYRGSLSLLRTKGKIGMTVVNHIALEEYLYGVVPNEMSPSWESEALKAQAVAARTFALHDIKKHAADGYDVCATTHCQVYRGVKSEHKESSAAVDRTAGEYLAYRGKSILSLFHASGGGYTENSENVWGKHEPYLRAVADYDQKSSDYQWTVKVTLAKLSSVLGDRASKIGKIRAIKLSKLSPAPMKAQDRGVSGRVTAMVIEGERGLVTLKGTEVRSLLGLKSTLFDIDKRTFGGSPSDTITIRGYGSGHGLGMSQWGAKEMAKKAGNKAGTYKQILSHYYCDTELKKI